MQKLLNIVRHQFKYYAIAKRLVPAYQQMCNLSESADKSPTDTTTQLTAGEQHIKHKLHVAFPSATEIQVSDVSGGCGAMYQIAIESSEFQGINKVQQHRMVNKALEEEIKSMHGLQLTTKVPEK